MVDPTLLVDPNTYTDDSTQYQLYQDLRRNDPVSWVEAEGFRPFWAISKDKHIRQIESSKGKFLAGIRTVLLPRSIEAHNLLIYGSTDGLRPLTHMDGARHFKHRMLTQHYFSPANVAKLANEIRHQANYFVDLLCRRSDDIVDFAADIAFWYPLRVILSRIGVPQADESMILHATQELFGYQDSGVGEYNNAADRLSSASTTLRTYFSDLAEDRRKNPQDDIATILANAEIHAAPLAPNDLISYFIIAATAGHDTTSACIAGGMKALMENPEQFEKLRTELSLLPLAVDEMIRWVAPVKHFLRTAAQDYELAGKLIGAGEAVMLLYASGCRDEEAVENPDQFVIDRDPSRHLAFGFGPHVCLGMHLARFEIQCFFEALIPRLIKIEPAGDCEFLLSSFVSGLKNFPVTADMC